MCFAMRQHVEFIKERKLLLEESAHAKALAEPLKALPVQHDRLGIRFSCVFADRRISRYSHAKLPTLK